MVGARARKRLPVVLGEAEVRAVREELEEDPALVVGLLYGGGLRLTEALRLRVQDLDFQRREITVRNGKDRRTLLPGSQCTALHQHLQKVHRLHQPDLEAGWGAVMLPSALARKYRHVDREWGWQWVFPQRNRWKDPSTGKEGRDHQRNQPRWFARAVEALYGC
ncbi:MAG: tyrosine-type recombinase/integrase [Cyanobium sp.]